MHREHGQGSRPIWLPMAKAQDLHSWSYFHQSLFWDRQKNSARQEKRRQGLPMSAAQTATRPEAFHFGLRTLHKLILIGTSRNNGGRRSHKCPFSSTSAKNAPTSSRPWFTVARRRSVPSAAARNWSRSYRCLRFRQKADRARLSRLVLAAVAVIPAARVLAHLGTWTSPRKRNQTLAKFGDLPVIFSITKLSPRGRVM